MDWFLSYLSDRKQIARINDKSSNISNVTCGVPQGSILWLLLFFIDIHDLCYYSSFPHLALFADDTSVLYKHNDLTTGARVINSELDWFPYGLKSTNFSWTFQNQFHDFPPSSAPNSSVAIMLDGTKLVLVNKAKFFGIHIDPRLIWKHRIDIFDVLCSKISRVIGLLFKISSFVPSYINQYLRDSLIHSHLTYCNLIWEILIHLT